MTLRSRVDEFDNHPDNQHLTEKELALHTMLFNAIKLLDHAMQGLEEVSQKADEVYGIGKDNTRFCGDIAKQTLADIRKQLNGDTNG